MEEKSNFEKGVEASDRLAQEPRSKEKNEITRNLPWFCKVEDW